MTSIVLSFDIGIKNLAFCCLKKENSKLEILDWNNVNLIEEAPKEKQTCISCKSSAKFTGAGKPFCTRHCPALLQPIKDASGNIYKKLPKLATLQDILISKNGVKVPLKSDRIMEEIQKHYSVPVVIAKKANANTTSLDVIHDALRDLVLKNKELWKTCTLICLENQPAFKNPHMKSIQMMLYATLRDIIQPPPPIHLVHAGKKVQGKEKGDSGYKDRKLGSEIRAEKYLKDNHVQVWSDKWNSAKKKNDLADALCMCIDSVVRKEET
jgi:hypothetical protein